MSRELTVSLLNIDQAALTVGVLEPLAALSSKEWALHVVLVDNGSRTDELASLHNWVAANRDRFASVLFIASSRNLGVTGGRNLAFRLGSTDRVLVLDNDLVLPSDSRWLEELAHTMDLDPQAAIVAPMLVFADRPDTVQSTGIGLTSTGRVGYLNRNREVAIIATDVVEVVAAPAACWLVRREAQQAVGLLSDAYYPMQYEDVDFCLRLRLAGWKTLCHPGVRIAHIENVTTRNLKEHPYGRTAARQWMTFADRWSDVLPQVATIPEDDISW
jgi:GT2 family glycosyltransferase